MNDSSAGRCFRRFLAYTLDYKGLLILAVTMGIGKFTLAYVFPWLLGSVIDDVIEPKGWWATATTEVRLHHLWVLVGWGVFFSLMHSVTTYGRGYFTAMLGNRMIADLRQDLFDHLHRLSLHFYSKERTGSIVSRLITDIQQAAQLINGGIVSVVMDMTHTLIGLYLLIRISGKLTAASMVIMPLYLVTFRVLNPRVKWASLRVQSQISKITGNVQERLSGIALIKTYAAESRERDRFVSDTEEHYDRVLQQSSLSQTIGGISEGLVHLGQVIVIGFGGYLAIRQGLTAGQITQFMGTLAVMYLPVRRFAEVNVVYQTSLAAIERVFQVFDITPKIVEKPEAVKTPIQRGEVLFENVSFDYLDESDESRISLEEGGVARADEIDPLADGQEAAAEKQRRWVLREISFTIPAGQRVALVGPSGSGKSTLVSLLPRLYDVTHGRISIDGADVRDFQLRTLRRGIGIVQQDSFLFSGSVRDNIAYGKPHATDDEVIEAAKAANAHEFISTLPDGYSSLLGERGVNLSGGQRQRISIARAILKNPRILILDEATSALDSESEALVQEALNRLMNGRTCFIIAHRLSTVRDVDRILVLQQGQIVESGHHDELLQHNGLYARLVRQQFGLVSGGVVEVK